MKLFHNVNLETFNTPYMVRTGVCRCVYNVVSFRLRGTFSHWKCIFVPTDMITRHGLMFVFPNRTINGPINHARVHNITDTISMHDNKLTLTLSPLQVEISKFISADLQFLFIHVIDFIWLCSCFYQLSLISVKIWYNAPNKESTLILLFCY